MIYGNRVFVAESMSEVMAERTDELIGSRKLA